MSKDLIVHMTKCVPTNTLVTMKTALWMSNLLGIPLKDEPETFMDKKQFRIIYVFNGPTAFCPFREEIEELALRCKVMVWIQNDYTCYPPSQLKRSIRKMGWCEDSKWTRPPIVWTTCPFRIEYPLDRYVNWNSMTFSKYPFNDEPRTPGILYYGAHREGRIDSFRKYFEGATYPITVSSSSRAKRHFKEYNDRIAIIPPMKNQIEEISKYRMTIYMEDKFSHKKFTSPANRFYECLSAGIAQVFDENSVLTMEEAGFDVHNYVCKTQKDVKRYLKNWKDIALSQRENWGRTNYRKRLANRVEKCHEELKQALKKKSSCYWLR